MSEEDEDKVLLESDIGPAVARLRAAGEALKANVNEELQFWLGEENYGPAAEQQAIKAGIEMAFYEVEKMIPALQVKRRPEDNTAGELPALDREYLGVKKEPWDRLYHAVYRDNPHAPLRYDRITAEQAREIAKKIIN